MKHKIPKKDRYSKPVTERIEKGIKCRWSSNTLGRLYVEGEE